MFTGLLFFERERGGWGGQVGEEDERDGRQWRLASRKLKTRKLLDYLYWTCTNKLPQSSILSGLEAMYQAEIRAGFSSWKVKREKGDQAEAA